MLFSKNRSDENIKGGVTEKIDLDDELSKSFYLIHETMEKKYLTPKRFLILLETYRQVYLTKNQAVSKRQQHLKSGVSKLSEARKVVDDLKRNAEIKQKELAVKQHEADEALKQITKSMAVSILKIKTKFICILMEYRSFQSLRSLIKVKFSYMNTSGNRRLGNFAIYFFAVALQINCVFIIKCFVYFDYTLRKHRITGNLKKAAVGHFPQFRDPASPAEDVHL